MTQTDQTPAPVYTSRTLPAPWGVCDACGGSIPALAHPQDNSHMCPACAQHDALRAAAASSLAAMLTPALGAWASHWGAAGLGEANVLYELEDFTGSNMDHTYRAQHLKDLLEGARAAHPAPSFTPSPPDRLTLDAASLPTLTGVSVDASAAPSAGEPDRRLTFTVLGADGSLSHDFTVSTGADVLLIQNFTARGDALLLELGIDGQSYYSERPAYLASSRAAVKVSPAVLPQVLAALGYWGGVTQ